MIQNGNIENPSQKLILLSGNMFGYIVRLLVWAVEGENKVLLHPVDSSNDEPQSLTNSITNFVNENGIESDNDCDDTLLDDSVEEPYEQNFKKLKEFKDAMKRKEKEEMENAQIKSDGNKRLSLKANEDVIKKPFVSVERLWHDDDLIHHYTGLQNYVTFELVYSTLIDNIGSIRYRSGAKSVDCLDTENCFFY